MLSILDRAVLRVAAWPVETVDAFASPSLAALVASLRAHEKAAEKRAPTLADAIHDAVPGVSDRTTRAWLLAVRRAVHGGTGPLPSRRGSSDLDPTLNSAIVAEAAQREMIAAARAEFGQAHERAYDADVRRLRDIASTPTFRRALAVSQLDVASRWERARRKPISKRSRSRRLEATLARFVLGACGRPTPRGTWAGVVPVSPAPDGADGPGLVVRSAPAHHIITVALEPFRAILAAWTPTLGRNPRQLLRLEPTLHGEDGRWWWEPSDGVGREWVRLEPEPVVRAVVEFWEHGAAKPAEALIEAARDTSGDAAAAGLAAAVDHLVDVGVLVCAVEMSTIADDSWAVLDEVAGQLKGTEHELWSATVTALRTELACLNADFEGHDPSAVIAHLREAEQEISALLTAAGAPLPQGPLLEVDTRLPFAATWDLRYRNEVGTAVEGVLGFHTSDGAAERYRRASVASLPIGATPAPILPLLAGALAEWSAHRAAVDAAAPQTRSDALLAMGCDPSVEERRWCKELEPHYAAHEHTIDVGGDSTGAGPFGSMLLVPGTRLWSRWGRPQPDLFTSRFAGLLPGGARDNMESDGIEVVGSDPENFNAAIHPDRGLPFVDPHGSAGVALRDISVEFDSESALPWLRQAGDSRRHRPVYRAPTVMGRRDPCSRVLRTLAMAHGWELVAWGFPALTAEIERWNHLPRLVLPGGTVISAERWTVPAATVAKIASAPSDVAKYRAWRDEADRLELPSVGLLRWRLNPGAPEMLFPTDSALAVCSVFGPLSSDAGPLVITEVPGDPDTWPIIDVDGNHYLGELAVTWFAETPDAPARREAR